MTQNINRNKMIKKILSIAILALLFSNCNGNVKSEDSKSSNDNLNAGLLKDSTNNIVEENKDVLSNDNNISLNYWSFYKISESSISETAKKTKEEIINQFKDIKIEIDDKNLKVENICTYEYYKSNKTPIKYYLSVQTAKLYESILAQNGIKLGNDITIYQSMYPEKACEIPWQEIVIIDNTLVIVYDDYLVFFRKGNDDNQQDCYSKTKITNLPITKNIINGNNVWNQLDCDIANLESKDYLRLPDINGIKVFIIGNFNYDDFTYTLVTLKNNKVITKKDVGFAKAGNVLNTVSEFTQFEISEDYIFSLTTKTKKGEDFKTLKTEKFKIDDNGFVIVVK